MAGTSADSERATGGALATGASDLKLEVVVFPVADVDRAKEFYGSLGWRLDADIAAGESFRVVQFTPPGSACSLHVGEGVTTAAPGSGKAFLVVSDIEAARAELAASGADVGDVYHNGPNGPESGPAPDRASYGSYATFSDPDGNVWQLQEITTRLPGRVAGDTTYTSVHDLAEALRRAEAAHGEHEQRTGEADANWPDWYAAYMIAEQAGTEPPT
jgi:catechol 2,3-dioxygenase-like lactoylglutathione lyase family enzyme